MNIEENNGVIQSGFFKRLKGEDIEEDIKALQKYSEEINCEGLVLKSSESKYDVSGTRTSEWVKLKNQGLFSDSMSDTIDLIPIGAFYGKGLRAGIFGAYLMAAYN